MFVITAVSLPEGGTGVLEARPLGVFLDELSAVVAVSDNDACLTDDLVVVERVNCGLLQPSQSTQWFKREPSGDYYVPVGPPPELRDLKLPIWRSHGKGG